MLEWALLLPLAVPAYVTPMPYTDWLQFSGPVQTWLRAAMGWQRGDYWFPEIRSVGGAAAMFVCVLYPYVYLLARVAFLGNRRAWRRPGAPSAFGARGLLPHPLADGAPRDRARRGARADGDAGRLRHRVATSACRPSPPGSSARGCRWASPVSAARLALMLLAFVAAVVRAERLARAARAFHDAQRRARRNRRAARGAGLRWPRDLRAPLAARLRRSRSSCSPHEPSRAATRSSARASSGSRSIARRSPRSRR
jgi:iron(III) transport system permease protein